LIIFFVYGLLIINQKRGSMQWLRFSFIFFILGAFSLNSSLFSDENIQGATPLEISPQELSIAHKKHSLNTPTGKVYVRKRVRFPYTGNLQPAGSIFFQTNIGVGFLYFSGLRGNLMGQPVSNFDPANSYRDVPLKGHLIYNKTPLFEYLLGYRFNPWLKLALSYQHQGGITIQTKTLSAHANLTAAPRTEMAQFTSSLSLDALLAKVYFEFPFAIVRKNISINPYLAMGIGPGWQSWTQIRVDYMFVDNAFTGDTLPLSQKISANAVLMGDLGLQVQKAMVLSSFSVLMGCKYNQWGQARSVGKMSQQGAHKLAIVQPLRIKTVYEFAPYLGMQWNFSSDQPVDYFCKQKHERPRVWLPYWTPSKEFQSLSNVWTQLNAGVGFLYFSGLRGNLMGRPSNEFAPQALWRDAPLKGRLSYNPTPLFESLLGYRFNAWLKLALSYQHQGGVAIQSKALLAFPDSTNPESEVVQFQSNLSLDALLAKTYFELPFAMIWRSLSMNPYLAVGIGAGIQSWTQIEVDYMAGNDVFLGELIFLRQKFSTNVVWMLDMGLRMQSAYPNSRFSVLLGCKYNQWGQARSIGKLSQQGSQKTTIFQPLRIKTVYQFAPYLGVEWNFSKDQSIVSSYKLKGKNPKVWIPYWVKSKEFQCLSSFWTQFNAGLGLLYFGGIKGNLMGQPSVDFDTNAGFRDVPFKGRLSYNSTPLFEYLLGYRINSWLKAALSYQYQAGITLTTKALQSYSESGTNQSNYVELRANLSLNAIQVKVYFELPFSMIWRSLSMNPYLALGGGAGWQSWTRVQVKYVSKIPLTSGDTLPLHPKLSVNPVGMVDAGLRVQSAYPNSRFSVLLGCKGNWWGQARNIGKMSNQRSLKIALTKPFRIKRVYQIAPYLGVQWSF